MQESSLDMCLRTTRSSIVRSSKSTSARRPSSAIPRLTEMRGNHDAEETPETGESCPVTYSSQTMNVYLRIKPQLTKSNRLKKIQNEIYVVTSATCLEMKSPSVEVTSCQKRSKCQEMGETRKFTFTKIFGPESGQTDLFEETMKGRIIDFLDGQSFTMMTYGTTNSGKTYTLLGDRESPGIIPRSIAFVFSSVNCTLAPWYKPTDARDIISLSEMARSQEIEARENLLSKSADKSIHEEIYVSLENSVGENREFDRNGEAMYSVWLSYVEIYNDSINDLLINEETRGKSGQLKLHVDKQGRPFVHGCRTICATTGLEAFRLLMFGRSRLTMASTNRNPQSSRSHAIFTMTLLKYKKEIVPEEVELTTMTFCDLAGTGKLRGVKTTGNTLLESKNINTSLMVLGKCLKGVLDSQTSRQNVETVVPFRESKLTRLFQRGIAGKENLCFIVNIDTSPGLFVETQAVLTFGSLAKRVLLENEKDPKRSCVPDLVMASPKCSPIRRDRPSTVAHFDTSTNQRRILSKLDVDQLKEENVVLTREVAILRETALNREYEIRQEMATLYTNIMKDVEANWQKRTKDAEEEQDSLLKWSVKQIETFYKERIDSLTHRKRRRTSGGDHVDERDLCEHLETENSRITSKALALRETVKKLQDEQETLSADKDKCVFELSLVKDVLNKIRNLLDEESGEKVTVNDDTDFTGLVGDLKSLIDEKNQTIADLKKSLEISKQDHVDTATKEFDDLSDQRSTILKSLTRKQLLKELADRTDDFPDDKRSIDTQTLEPSITIEEKEIDAKFSSSTFKKESNRMFLPSSTRLSITESSIIDEDHCVNDSTTSPRNFSFRKEDSLKHLPINFFETIENVFSSGVETDSKNDSGIAISNAVSSSTENSLSITSEEKSSQTNVTCENKDGNLNDIIQERVEQLKVDYGKLKAEHLRETHRVTELAKELESIQESLVSLRESTRQNEIKIIEYQEKLMSRERDLSSLGQSKFQMERQLLELSKKLESRSIAYEDKIVELRDELKIRETKESHVVLSLEECHEKISILESQLAIAHEQIDKTSIKCFTEHVPKIEQLENELAAKRRFIRESNQRIASLEKDLERVHDLHERVVNFAKICDDHNAERDELKRQLHERTEIQQSLEHKIKKLMSKAHERENEIVSLRLDLSNVVKMNMENSERARDLSREIALAHDKLANVREEIARSEEERRKLERTSGHEIGNLVARLADFEKNASILARMRENEDSRMDQLDNLKLLLHEKEREMALFKKNREKTIRRYEALIRKLQADVELRCNRESSKLKMLYPKRSMSRDSLRSVTESLKWKATLRQSVEKVRSTQAVLDTRKCRKCLPSNYSDRKCSRSYPTCSTVVKRSSSRALAVSTSSLEDSRSSGSKRFPFRYEDDDDEDEQSGGHEIIELETFQTESRTELNLDLSACHDCGRRDGLSQAVPTFSLPSTSDESFTDFSDLPKWMEIRRTNGRAHCHLLKRDTDAVIEDKGV